MPGTMLVAAMFFTSTYFTFRDCFQTSPETPESLAEPQP